MKLKGWLIRWLGLGSSMHVVHQRQKILETQLDFLIRNSGRKLRRKWHRMITRRTSPNYVGKDIASDILSRKGGRL